MPSVDRTKVRGTGMRTKPAVQLPRVYDGKQLETVIVLKVQLGRVLAINILNRLLRFELVGLFQLGFVLVFPLLF